jgi:negative regulator of replication initiation
MSLQIDLDADIFDYLKSQAEPFVDTPNTVLRRLLGLSEPGAAAVVVQSAESPGPPTRKASAAKVKKKAAKAAPTRTRAASGTLLPEDRYELPLLRVLADAGGQAPYRDVVEAVGRELKEDLLPADFEKLNSGAVRWQSRLQFVRLRLIERGYLDKDSPRGIWGITDAGRLALEEGDQS